MDTETVTQTGTPKIPYFNIIGTFDDDLLNKFVEFHRKSVDEGVTEAFIYVNSPGGSVFAFEGIQAIVNSDEIAYHTVNLGYACSAGCLLMAQGGFRWAQPQSIFMFHDAAMMNYGKMEELKETQKIFEKQCQRAVRVFADQTNKSLDWWVDKAYSHKTNDYWFDAKTAQELGVIDFIGLPTLKKNPPVQIELPINAEDFNDKLAHRLARDNIRIEEYMNEESTIEENKLKNSVKKKSAKKKATKKVRKIKPKKGK